jgi:hypothetical protein
MATNKKPTATASPPYDIYRVLQTKNIPSRPRMHPILQEKQIQEQKQSEEQYNAFYRQLYQDQYLFRHFNRELTELQKLPIRYEQKLNIRANIIKTYQNQLKTKKPNSTTKRIKQ